MNAIITEKDVEQIALEWFAELGYATVNGAEIGPDSEAPERKYYGQAFLPERLKAAINKLNPHLSDDTKEKVCAKLEQNEHTDLLYENRRLHEYIKDGITLDVRRDNGDIVGETAQLIDFQNIDNNDFFVVNQWTMIENNATRRADIVVFINGLPLAVLELKNPSSETADLQHAHNQLTNYAKQIPSLFRTNAIQIISDGIYARIGALFTPYERFMPWRIPENEQTEKFPELESMIRSVFKRDNFLELIKDFIVFGEDNEDNKSSMKKILGGYHQFYAVKKALEFALKASAPDGDRKAGVIWHTQGSGKSLLMIFYAGKIIQHLQMKTPTLLVLTDRNDLDDQLFKSFNMYKSLLRQTPQQAKSRQHLCELLTRTSDGVVFSTLQKFAETTGMLSDRENIIVIADEAHRSQYGLGAKINKETGDMHYGFAKYMRDALPNASFIGFTGTPLEKSDANTPALFGDYIDIYDISRAVEDGTTVKIYYESRLAKISLDKNEAQKIDVVFAELENVSEDEQAKILKQTKLEAIVGTQKRLSSIAADLLTHFDDRQKGQDGKAMIVCMSRRICVELYGEIIKLRPEWHSDDATAGQIKVVMSGGADDPPSFQPHIGEAPKKRHEILGHRIKNAEDSLKIVLVCDMWLTGFDAPCLHTLYVDKPMREHGLMQAIARVNRVFRDKLGGLVVDYIGIAQNLQNALQRYTSSSERTQVGIKYDEAVRVLEEKMEIVRAMFRPDSTNGLDYRPALLPTATPQQRLKLLGQAINWVLEMQYNESLKVTDEKEKNKIHRRFADAVLSLSRAFSLAAASDVAKNIREEVAFMQAVRVALQKSTPGTSITKDVGRDFEIRQMINQAIVSVDIEDIMESAGFNRHDISILSDEFLEDIKNTEQKHLAIEALKKLITGNLRTYERRNVVSARRFSERLAEAVARYHANAITTSMMIEELIKIAKDFKTEEARGEANELDDKEIAFYDALADNKSARDLMGDETLQKIARELVKTIQNNICEDWTKRPAVRAGIRIKVKKLLEKYKYPPDLQIAAVQKVVQQAEALAANEVIYFNSDQYE